MIKEKLAAINLKLNELNLALSECKKEKKEIEEEVEKTKIFKVKEIGEILEELLTKVTKSNYVYTTVNGHVFIPRFDNLDKWLEKESRIKFFLVKEDGYIPDLAGDLNYTAYESGELIYLHMESPFASIDKLSNVDMSDIGLEKLPIEVNFVSQFMTELIEYRLNNDLVEITKESMQEFLNDYLERNLNDLSKHYKKNKPRIVYVRK